MIANYAATPPSSLARWDCPMPGIEAAVLRRDEHGHVVVEDGEAVEVATGRRG